MPDALSVLDLNLLRLAEGELDLAVGPAVGGTRAAGIERFVVRPLRHDELVCAMPARHASMRRKWSLDAFLANDHVTVATARPGKSEIDEAIERAGRVRRVAFAVPSVGMALSCAASSDLFTVVPKQLVEHVPWKLATRPVPLALAPKATFVVWAPRSTNDARHRYVRESLLRAAARG